MWIESQRGVRVVLAAGTKLGPYEVQSAVGAGGMGEVYRARDVRLGREVAVKVLPESFARDQERLRRFEQEARTVASLNHPNILALHDIGSHDGSPYLVSELLDGESLRQRLTEGALPGRKALDYGQQIANGLAAAHEKGVVHRDLKPDNIFITRDGRVKILDFGLAKLRGAQPGVVEAPTVTGDTSPGVVMGTVGYMSPEQVRGQTTDHRSDIFSFGAVLYEMLSGKRAFRGETSVETMNAILKEEPLELTGSGLSAAPGLERIVRRCLEKRPEERFQSARDLAFAIEAVSGTSSASAVQTAPAGALAIGRGRWLAAVLGLIAVLIVGALVGGKFMPPAAFPRYIPLTIRPGTIFSARFAPDGETVLFSASFNAESPDIYLWRLDSPEPQALGLAPAILQSVSRTGEMAVMVNARFVAHLQWEGTLAVAPIGSRGPREILENVLSADYGPDGSLAVAREMNGKIRIEYPAGKLLYETAGWVSSIRVSPDGARVAFLDHPKLWDNRGALAVVDRAGHKITLSDGWSSLEGVAWSPKSDEVWFGGSTGGFGGTVNTRAVLLSGKTREVLAGAGGMTVMDISTDGRQLAANESEEHGIMFSRSGQAERDLSWLNNSVDAYLSPDGKTMLFHDASAGQYYTVCIRKTNGSPVTQLGPGAAWGLSPDGKWALSIIYSDPPKLEILPIGPGERITLERGPLAVYHAAGWLPDGKAIIFTGNEAGKRVRAYVQAITGGIPKPIAPEGVEVVPRRGVSPDSKWMTAIDAEQKIVLYPMNGGESRPVPGVEPGEVPIRFNGDGSALYVARSGPYPVSVYEVDVKSGRRQLLRQLDPAERTGMLPQRADRGFIDATPDGSAIAYTYVRIRGGLYLVEQPR
jgi:eukaryotic-like serine/threonine-protein kinase